MKNMVDVCGGKMTLKDVSREIFHYMYYKSPKRLIVDIKRKEDGYHATLWMSKKDFERRPK